MPGTAASVGFKLTPKPMFTILKNFLLSWLSDLKISVSGPQGSLSQETRKVWVSSVYFEVTQNVA